jgi:hypothetical protein
MSTLGRMRYKITRTSVRVPIVWLRHRHFSPADIFLGCYPRSGNTWLRFMLFELLAGKPSDFASVNSAFRGPGDHQSGVALLPRGGRLIGTHEVYRAEYKRALYLVRDVRDVVLSYFAHERELGVFTTNFDEYLVELLTGKKKRYGTWQVHVESWLESPTANSGNLLVVRYHDLRRDTESTLAQIIEFLGVSVSREKIEAAVANNSLAKMRAKEDNLHTYQAEASFPHRPQRGSSEEGRFVRSGSVGGWRGRLSDAQIRLTEKYAGGLLLRIGCPLASLDAQNDGDLVVTSR